MNSEISEATPPDGAALLTITQHALEDLKAVEPVVLDVRELSSVMDWLVVASGTSSRHVKSLADNVLMKAKESGKHRNIKEGQIIVDKEEPIVRLTNG